VLGIVLGIFSGVSLGKIRNLSVMKYPNEKGLAFRV
jgi:hypothetical protein